VGRALNSQKPAGAWKPQLPFPAASDFKPVKLILTPWTDKHKSFRIDISGIVKP
jgi:hypothetical protein